MLAVSSFSLCLWLMETIQRLLIRCSLLLAVVVHCCCWLLLFIEIIQRLLIHLLLFYSAWFFVVGCWRNFVDISLLSRYHCRCVALLKCCYLDCCQCCFVVAVLIVAIVVTVVIVVIVVVIPCDRHMWTSSSPGHTRAIRCCCCILLVFDTPQRAMDCKSLFVVSCFQCLFVLRCSLFVCRLLFIPRFCLLRVCCFLFAPLCFLLVTACLYDSTNYRLGFQHLPAKSSQHICCRFATSSRHWWFWLVVIYCHLLLFVVVIVVVIVVVVVIDCCRC